jgi:multidrug resistance efflux pump
MAVPTETLEFDTAPLYSAKLLNASTPYRTFGKWVLGLFVALLVSLLLPWQQFVSGKGTLSALRPQDRPQTVPAAIAGRIEAWLVVEGQFVKAGTPLVQISEVKEKFLDPQLVSRIGEQVEGKSDAVEAKMRQVIALDQQIVQLERALTLSVEQGTNKIAEYEAAYDAALVDSTIAADRLRRRAQLVKEGLSSQVDLETFTGASQKANATLIEKRQGLANSRIELDSKRAEYREKISKAISDREKTKAEIGEGQAEVAKLRNEYTSMEIRAGFYIIKAPQDGFVVRAQRAGVGEVVKEGEAVVTVQPANPQLAVELFVRAMDVPFVKPGRKVRIQFDGYPSLQFVGWDVGQIGTFGGVIQVIDYTASASGEFRVLVVPDSADDPWPEQLRIGGRVNGWAMLDNVTVGYELWRQINGFPPQKPSDSGSGKKASAEPKD